MSVKIHVFERTADNYTVPENSNGTSAKSVRAAKFKAEVASDPAFWASGKSIPEAIGALVQAHPRKFGVLIKDIGRQSR